jgi:hypothetical protein
MDVPRGRTDLRVLVSGEIFHQEIDETAIPLQDCEHLKRAIGGLWLRRFLRLRLPPPQRRSNIIGDAAVVENREKRAKREFQATAVRDHRIDSISQRRGLTDVWMKFE